MLDVALVGVGPVGSALAAAWHHAGLEVGLVGRTLDSSTMISIAAAHGLRRLHLPDAVGEARAVVLADPCDDPADLFDSVRGSFPTAVFVDASTGGGDASRTEVLRSATGGAQVYRAFNTLGWSELASEYAAAELPDVFYAGPDDEGRDIVEGLVGSLALRPVYLGGYERMRLIDSLAELRDAVQTYRPGREVAVRLLERFN
jgi:predicted dinucleotide-binding enzyme